MSVPLDDDELEIARVAGARRRSRPGPRDEWIKLFDDADLAVKPVLRPAEILDDAQVRHAGDDGRGRATRCSGGCARPARSSCSPTRRRRRRRRRRAPTSTATEALTVPLGVAGPAAADRPAAGSTGALDGVRILDLSSFFATGYGAKLLADLGADVIKIEQPAGDQLRPFPDPFEACNRGKRSLAIDLRTPAGLAAVDEARRHRRRRHAQPAAGQGREARRRPRTARRGQPRPDLRLPPGVRVERARGGTRRASSRCCPGFTGVLYQAAGEGNPPIRKAFGNADYYNGLLGATAVLMALEHRARTGRAQYVESPHLHSSLFVMSENITTPDGTPLRPDLVLDDRPARVGRDVPAVPPPPTDGSCVTAVGDRAFRRLVSGARSRGPRRRRTGTPRRRRRQGGAAAWRRRWSGRSPRLTTEGPLARLEAGGRTVRGGGPALLPARAVLRTVGARAASGSSPTTTPPTARSARSGW